MELKLIERKELLGKEIKVYGNADSFFVLAKDVAEWIGHSNVTDMISRVDANEVTKFNLGGQKGMANFLTEDGLYEVLMQSRKPVAKQFKDEVKKILKTIRKTGGYVAENRAIDFVEAWLPDLDETAKHVVAGTLEKNKQLIAENKELKPKAEKYDRYLDSEGYAGASDLKDLFEFRSAQAFNNWLKDEGVQHKRGNSKYWTINAKYAWLHDGYVKVITHTYGNESIKWTPKGIDWLMELIDCQ